MKKLTEEEKQKLKEGIQRSENDRAARRAKESNGNSRSFGGIIGALFVIFGIFRILKGIGGILPSDYKQGVKNVDTINAETWIQKGAALVIIGRDTEALECYDKALETDPRPDIAWFAWTAKGSVLSSNGRDAEALECFDKALAVAPEKTKPEMSFAWQGRGLSLTGLGNYAEAIECFDKALELNPVDFTLWDSKGGTLFFLKRYEESIECHDKALEINPDFTYAYCGKGSALAGLERYEEARECFTKFIGSWNPKGWSEAEVEKVIEEAQKCLKKIERAGH